MASVQSTAVQARRQSATTTCTGPRIKRHLAERRDYHPVVSVTNAWWVRTGPTSRAAVGFATPGTSSGRKKRQQVVAGSLALDIDTDSAKSLKVPAIRRDPKHRIAAKKKRSGTRSRPGRSSHHIQINKRLTHAGATVEVLLSIVESQLGSFNNVNTSTALNRIQRKLPRHWQSRLSPDCKERLVVAVNDLGHRLLEQIPSCDPVDLATAAHAIGKIGVRIDGGIIDAIAAAAAAQIKDFKPKEIALICWAFAKMGRDAPELFSAIAESCSGPDHRLRHFSAYSLALLVWGLATSGADAPELFRLASREGARKLPEFSAQNLANFAWAYATVRHYDCDLVSALADEASGRLREFSPQGISMLVWSMSKLEVEAGDLFRAVVPEAMRRLGAFNPQELSTLAWAFARSEIEARELFMGIADEALACVHQFGPQDISNMLYAFAQAKVPAPSLFSALAAVALPQIPWFTAQALCNSAWAIATANAEEQQLLQAIADEALCRLEEFTPQNLSNLAWSFAVAGVDAPELFHCLANEATLRIEEFSPQSLGNIAYAFALAEVDSSKLFHALAPEVELKLGQMKQQEMSNVMWALATTGRKYPELLEATLNEAVSRRLQGFAPQALANMLWSFAILHHEPRPDALLEAAQQRALDVPGAFSAQELANILHAHAIYDCLDASVVRTFVMRMEPSDLDDKVCHSLYQSCLAVQLHDPDVSVQDMLPDSIRKRAEELWKSQVTNTTHSWLQTQVFGTLLGMGFTGELEWQTADGLFSVDIMLADGDMLPFPVAVEVDGPSHYTRNNLEELGPSRLRNRLVEARVDKRLVDVPFFDWRALRSKRQKEAYLHAKLTDVCNTPGSHVGLRYTYKAKLVPA